MYIEIVPRIILQYSGALSSILSCIQPLITHPIIARKMDTRTAKKNIAVVNMLGLGMIYLHKISDENIDNKSIGISASI